MTTTYRVGSVTTVVVETKGGTVIATEIIDGEGPVYRWTPTAEDIADIVAMSAKQAAKGR